MAVRSVIFLTVVCAFSGVYAEEIVFEAEDSPVVFERVAALSVCFDFGCKSRQDVYVHTPEWQAVEMHLSASRNAADERERIAEAVAFMEQIVGSMTPTDRDRGGNDFEGDDSSGQMDCIDESTNTTRYLNLFEERGLLKWHRVKERVYRAPRILDQHWSAQIEHTATGQRYAVDSWFRDNGERPYVQSVEAWKRKEAFTATADGRCSASTAVC
jgi:hypothetical protein